MNYQYQIDWGGGYENVYPDFYEIEGREDTEWWFEATKETGCLRARILFGGNEIEERTYKLMKKVIETKYIGPGNVRGTRIKATTEKESVTIPYDHSLNLAENHETAAEALRQKLAWKGEFIIRGEPLPSGGMVFILSD